MNIDHDAADIHGVPDSERLSRAGEIAGGKAVADENCTERDIVERIRSLRYVHVPQASQLFEEACQEIEALRSRPCPYVTGTVTRYCTLTPLTLTEDERLAIKTALVYLKEDEEFPGIAEDKAALRGLLERLGGER